MTGELIRYDAMCHAIDAAYTVDEIKEIRNQAIALEHYSRQAHNTEAERRCCEIRLRAERKAGKLLAKTEKQGPGQYQRSDRSTVAPKLSDLGITRDQSSQWQKLAAVPEPEFEAALGGPSKPTTNGIIVAAAPPKETPVSEEALWLWGRLKEFDRSGLLTKDQSTVLATMLPHMASDVLKIAPCVAAWLEAIK